MVTCYNSHGKLTQLLEKKGKSKELQWEIMGAGGAVPTLRGAVREDLQRLEM